MRILAVIQARMNSTRLPQKIMTPLCGKPMLWHIVNRVNRSGLIHQVVIATSLKPEDDIVESFANENNFFIDENSSFILPNTFIFIPPRVLHKRVCKPPSLHINQYLKVYFQTFSHAAIGGTNNL